MLSSIFGIEGAIKCILARPKDNLSGGFRGGKGGANAPPLVASSIFLHT